MKFTPFELYEFEKKLFAQHGHFWQWKDDSISRTNQYYTRMSQLDLPNLTYYQFYELVNDVFNETYEPELLEAYNKLASAIKEKEFNNKIKRYIE